jgi:MFS family permease
MVQTVFWAQMEEEMGLTVTELTNAQSAQLAGLAVGCLLFIPFSVKYGRRPAYIISTAALTASAWWSARITTFWELIVSMLLCGLAGAINETLCQMTVGSTTHTRQKRARY